MAGIRKKDPKLMKDIQAFVENYYFECHNSPTLQTIAAGVGVNKTTVYRYLLEMDKNGIVSYDGKNIKTPNMRKMKCKMNRAPIIGNVVCGALEYAEEDFEEFVALPVALFGEGDLFVLRTHGDSMIDVGIEDGDKVVVKKQDYARYGDMIVALVDTETTLKTYYPEPEKHRIRLHPENKDMEDIIVNNCVIQGVVKHVIKSF